MTARPLSELVDPGWAEALEPVSGQIAAMGEFLRGEVVRRVNLKFAPDIRFRMDESFENAARIDALLNSAKVRSDLEGDAQDDAEGES